MRKLMPMRRIRNVLKELPHDCEEMREMHGKIEEYRHEFVIEMRKQNLDAIICPAFGSYPPKHGAPNKMISATSYTALYNLIDFPAGTVPIGKIGKNECEFEGNGDIWDKLVGENLKGCEGLSISVQIATPPFKDEMCLRIMRDVEKYFDKGKNN
ncbi:unnamed protein product [Caenorhabditis angaria]|uniref:Amidase domain-containing protein n=1 Tax=Caenorhabditis angaria TaxID=860376 RepID=A0A9P1IQK2_9PELO|nr:unnamed protein product [Caenorhabditis angaria]